ncbi:tetratricopeptide repeat protein [Parapedobacter koreensis]|uniref:Tetratricopeptide repeat-containing protein n=1 Tax=Parapedobacter koreensis TaxID=332977 RepID=A0A1H7R3V8_9SPHI|nr:hypothetical protein [Parapedobacter koreensis]SEL54257.1 hypothetical protein SAMN05421740_106230 [Parapedobacter koreensis]
MVKWWIYCLSLFVVTACGQRNTNRYDPNAGLSDCELAERLYNQKGNQGSARSQQYLDSAIALCPAFAKAWHEKSVPYLKRGDYATWMQLINKVVELEPSNYLDTRGWCKVKFLHDYAGGLADLQRYDTLVAGSPKMVGDFNIHSWMAFAKLGLQDSSAALKYFDQTIDEAIRHLGPEWVGYHDYLYRGILKMELKDYDGALADLDRQIAHYDKLADGHYYRGLLLAKIGKKAQALASLEKAKALFTGDGYHAQDPYVEMPWQIYLEDIERALLQYR